MTNFRALLDLLLAHKVEFIVVGGVAAMFHGSSRTTFDLDVVYARNRENLQRIVEALAAHEPYLRGAPPGLPFRWDAQMLRNGLNFTLTTSLGDLDLLGDITGIGTYEQLRPYSDLVELLGTPCLCVRLEQLIYLKKAAGRQKDFDALAELISIAEERSKKNV
jgi:predicted nucleotidyltransferase